MTPVKAKLPPGPTEPDEGSTRTLEVTVNGTDVVSGPRGVLIMTRPVVALTGTSATTADGVTSMIRPADPLNDTEVTPVLNPVPTKLTCVSAGPSRGEKPSKVRLSAGSRRIAVKLPAAS